MPRNGTRTNIGKIAPNTVPVVLTAYSNPIRLPSVAILLPYTAHNNGNAMPMSTVGNVTIISAIVSNFIGGGPSAKTIALVINNAGTDRPSIASTIPRATAGLRIRPANKPYINPPTPMPSR